MTDKVVATPSSDRSPEALLKQAVSGAKAKAAPAAKSGRRLPVVDRRMGTVAAAALVLGLAIGAGAMTLAPSKPDMASAGLAQMQSHLDARHAELARLQGDVEKVSKVLAQVQDATEAVRSEAKNRAASLNDRIGKAEQAVIAKMTGFADRQEQTERDQTAEIAALTAQIEKRQANPIPAPSAPAVAPQAAKMPAAEPTETGSIADKTKPSVIDSWAVREVYNGVAVIEDRRHRLVEVGPGDTVPGVGRVDSIERKGRGWAVVTKQGLITNQTW